MKPRWLVTAGPTREPIDPVRYIGNRSSGRMGYAIAAHALAAGGDVELVSGPVALEPPDGARTVRIETARQMRDAAVEALGRADIVVMSAAVADFRPVSAMSTKIKKGGRLTLDLEPTEDILEELGRQKRHGQVLIGFALEAPEAATGGGITETMRALAEAKLRRKRLDAICLNGPAAIGAERSELSAYLAAGAWEDWGALEKPAHAAKVVALGLRLLAAKD